MPHLRLLTVALLVSLSLAAEERRGGIAFHYATPLSPRELEWYSRFNVLVTHDPLPRAQVDALHARGTRLALYEWSVAYYHSLRTLWHSRQPRSMVLNERPLRGHLGAADSDAYYYDPATREHQRGRAEMLARRLRALGYDGIFFDTTTSHSVHPEALAEYKLRHPELPYDEAFAGFLQNLRREGVRLIVTNQGYREADHVLPHVDWDVTESLITFPREGRFVLRPWNDSRDPWNSTVYLMRNLIGPARRKFPDVRYAHISYVDEPQPARIAEIVAISLLFDAQPVIAKHDVATTIESDLLLLDFGEPKSTFTGTHRFFERGFVAYNASAKTLRVPNDDEYEDAVTGKRVRGTIVVPPRTARLLRRVR
ncbi:MAG TPA: hypothetical protein VF883_21560 [Thermoanaerobaculia bacterium]